MNYAERLATLLYMQCIFSAPVLSGNTRDSIKLFKGKDEHTYHILINPRYYDINLFEKEGNLVFYAGNKDSYANDVNEHGGFHSGNKSKGWVDRTCLQVSNIIANEIGGEMKADLKKGK